MLKNYLVVTALVTVSGLEFRDSSAYGFSRPYSPDYYDVLIAPTHPCPASCRLPLDHDTDNVGEDLTTSWSYNLETKKCEPFKRNFGENANNFESEELCQEKCSKCRNYNNLTYKIYDGSEVGIPDTAECDCQWIAKGWFEYGCQIVVAPPLGWKCKCRHKGPFYCTGTAIKCDNVQELCPADCSSKKCCELGSGNCAGYPTLLKTAPKSPMLTEFRNCVNGLGVGAGNNLNHTVDPNSDLALYEILNHQWNIRLPKVRPIAYFLPTSSRDVQFAVRCAAKYRIPVIPKSGGLSYEAYSFGNSESMIIDFRKMDQILVHPEDNSTNIGPGAVVGQITHELWKYGRGIPMGNCLTVGLGGHAIGGGIGYLTNQYGLAQDSVKEVTIVKANGDLVVASAERNPDIYWALRGGGGGYLGIATDFKLKTFPARDIKLTFLKLQYRLENAAQLWNKWEEWLQWVNQEEPTIFSVVFVRGMKPPPISPIGPGFEIHLLHIEDPLNQPKNNSDFRRMARKIFPKFGTITETNPNYRDFVAETGHLPIVTKVAGKPALTTDWSTLRNATSLPRYFKCKSFFVKSYVNGKGIDKVAEVLNRIPDINIWLMITGEGGVLRSMKPEDTAFVHRRTLYSISLNYEGTPYANEVMEGMGWLYEFWNTIQYMDGGETYQNYVDSDLKDYLKRYYGSNLKRLLEMKRRLDPTDYFKHAASFH